MQFHLDRETQDYLVMVGDGTTIVADDAYDADGQRAVRHAPDGTSVYATALYGLRNGAQQTQHVFVGETRVASRVQAAGASPTTEHRCLPQRYRCGDRGQATRRIRANSFESCGALVNCRDRYPQRGHAVDA